MQQDPIYTPLPPQSIRLLTILPSTSSTSPISCTLDIVSFNSSLVYDALSYVWGDTSVRENILVNGQNFLTPANVHYALRQLRHHDRKHRMWIDYICINQDDIAEREQQVSIMADIYRFAESVRVWLGPASDKDAKVMEKLKMISEQSTADSPLNFGFLKGDDNVSLLELEQFEHFFARPWWYRLWVVQEVALSGRVIFQCGPDSIDFDTFQQAHSKASSHYYRYCRHGSDGDATPLRVDEMMRKFGRVSMLAELRALCRDDARGDALPLHQLNTTREKAMRWLAMTNALRSRSCLLSHDRVYAVHGLLPSEIAKDPKLVPSYSVKAEEAYTKTALAVIEASESLAIFSYLDVLDDSNNDLPSWVPNWHSGIKNHQGLGSRLARESLFSAGGARPLGYRQVSGHGIALKAMILDRITVCSPADFSYPLATSLDKCFENWRKIWTSSHSYQEYLKKGLTEEQLEIVFQRTMLWNCTPITSEQSSQLERIKTKTEFERMRRAYLAGLDQEVAADTSTDSLGSMEDDLRRLHMATNTVDRVFFMTATGGIGVAEHNIEVDDHVLVVAGNTHPVILRHSKKYSNTWRAVSECYLHGWMDGQAVALAKSGEVDVVKLQQTHFDMLEKKHGHLPQHPLSGQVAESPRDGWYELLIL